MIKLIASDLDGTLLRHGAQALEPGVCDLIHKPVPFRAMPLQVRRWKNICGNKITFRKKENTFHTFSIK